MFMHAKCSDATQTKTRTSADRICRSKDCHDNMPAYFSNNSRVQYRAEATPPPLAAHVQGGCSANANELEAESVAQQVMNASDVQSATRQAGKTAPNVMPPTRPRRSFPRMGGHPGRQLEPASKRLLEERFGFDFGQVRIHTDRASAGLTAALNARALTVGSDIVFAPGEFRTGSRASLRLLAHELTHVIQQDSGHSPLSVQCAECDTGGMCNNLADSADLLNLEVNRRLAEARRSIPSPATVVTRAAWLLGRSAGLGGHVASIEAWANGPQVVAPSFGPPSRVVPVSTDESPHGLITRGGGFYVLPPYGTKYEHASGGILSGNYMYRYLAPAVNLNGFCVGTDKIGHMFQQGYQYFQVYQRFEARRSGSGLAAATAWGEWTEGHLSAATEHDAALMAWLNTIQAPRGMFGLTATGVHSRGDLAANRAGLQFYRDLLADPSMTFDIRRYVTADWDEEQVGNIYRHDIGAAVIRAGRLNPNDVILPAGTM